MSTVVPSGHVCRLGPKRAGSVARVKRGGGGRLGIRRTRHRASRENGAATPEALPRTTRSTASTRQAALPVRLAGPSGPGKARTGITTQGHSRAVFRRAIERDNLAVAEIELRGMGRVSLVELLELTALIARKNPARRSRVAARWLLRYLEAADQATIEEAAMVAGSLAALGGPGHDDALPALMGAAERASRGRLQA